MNFKGQHIGRLFTFLTGLIILAHAVVPHHHHFELTHSSEENSSCESSAVDNSNENPGTHCHALNILVSEKTNNLSFNNSLREYFNFFLPGIIVNLEIPPIQNFSLTIFGDQAISLKQFFFTANSLRAPPVNA